MPLLALSVFNSDFFGINYLNDILVCDQFGKKHRFVIIYRFTNLTDSTSLTCMTSSIEGISCFSIEPIIQAAQWPEREGWELFGVIFEGNSNMTRLLTDYGFKGFPLRKDYPLSGYSEIFYSNFTEALEYVNVEFMQKFRKFEFNVLNWPKEKYSDLSKSYIESYSIAGDCIAGDGGSLADFNSDSVTISIFNSGNFDVEVIYADYIDDELCLKFLEVERNCSYLISNSDDDEFGDDLLSTVIFLILMLIKFLMPIPRETDENKAFAGLVSPEEFFAQCKIVYQSKNIYLGNHSALLSSKNIVLFSDKLKKEIEEFSLSLTAWYHGLVIRAFKNFVIKYWVDNPDNVPYDFTSGKWGVACKLYAQFKFVKKEWVRSGLDASELIHHSPFNDFELNIYYAVCKSSNFEVFWEKINSKCDSIIEDFKILRSEFLFEHMQILVSHYYTNYNDWDFDFGGVYPDCEKDTEDLESTFLPYPKIYFNQWRKLHKSNLIEKYSALFAEKNPHKFNDLLAVELRRTGWTLSNDYYLLTVRSQRKILNNLWYDLKVVDEIQTKFGHCHSALFQEVVAACEDDRADEAIHWLETRLFQLSEYEREIAAQCAGSDFARRMINLNIIYRMVISNFNKERDAFLSELAGDLALIFWNNIGDSLIGPLPNDFDVWNKRGIDLFMFNQFPTRCN